MQVLQIGQHAQRTGLPVVGLQPSPMSRLQSKGDITAKKRLITNQP